VIWLWSGAGRTAEDSLAQARRQAEEYAQRSDEYRARPARPLSVEEAQAKKVIVEAAGILAEAETDERFGQAASLYRQAIEIAPKYDEAWSGLGNAYFLQGLNLPREGNSAKEKKLELYGRGKEACSKAQTLDPQSPAANLCLANLLLAEGEVKGMVASAWVLPEVFKLSDRIAAIDPYYDDGAIFRTFAVVLYIVPSWLARSFGFAPEIILPYLDKALERAPDRFVNYSVRAGIYKKMGQKEKALDDLGYMLSHDPAALPEFQRENRMQQQKALRQWKDISGRDYPGR